MIEVLLLEHVAFCLLFALRLLGWIRPRAAANASVNLDARRETRAGWLLTAHGAAFGVFYAAFALAVSEGGGRLAWSTVPTLGALVNVLGIGLLAWTFRVFHSWRLLARLEPGHVLCTSGPFRWIRHPIYLACDLLAVGTAIAVGAVALWLGAVLVILGGDLRARAEERVLAAAFGPVYRLYLARSKRWIPGLY